MDTGVIITAAIFIALCSLPFIISSRRRKKIEKDIIQSLTHTAKNHNGNISQYEIGGNYAIGIDEVNSLLFFKNRAFKGENIQSISLANIQNCEKINVSKSIKTRDDQYNVIERLALQLIPKKGNEPNTEWVFYDAANHLQLNGELQSMEKWFNLIKERM